MWNEIKTNEDIAAFMKKVLHFHDSCIKEIRYISGAYVKENLAMLPSNTLREVEIIFQRQWEDPTALVLKFTGVDVLHLIPYDPDKYTCEIFSASMFIKNGKLYWAQDEPDPDKIEEFDETWICAEKVFWKDISGCLGDKRVYTADYDLE